VEDPRLSYSRLELDMTSLAKPVCLCGKEEFKKTFTYKAPPAGEIRFQFSGSAEYFREVIQCETCGHYLSMHAMDASQLYSGDYIESTYGADGLKKNFERIQALPPEKSDNVARVRRVVEFMDKISATFKSKRVLDVGSGLGVFLSRMKDAGWNGTGLDTDPRQIKHLQETVGVSGVCAEFKSAKELGRFELITFNKVLEHVLDPVSMLANAKEFLIPGGIVYIELPDGEMAALEGGHREEFFIDHPHIFSLASTAVLAARAGFAVKTLERLREPSTKYTIRAFLERFP
jgi:SAM-dependent methyltransferase